MAASKRINKEIEDLRKAANDHYSAGPEGTDIFKWTGESIFAATVCIVYISD